MLQYDLVHKIYNDNQKEIKGLIEKSAFPITFEILGNFSFKINEILRSLEFMESDKAFYASQGLIRILYEHFLVMFYIWTKCRIDENDDCAIDYYKYYAMYELIKQRNFNSRLDKTYDDKKSPLQNFLTSTPEYENKLTENDLREINFRANKFDIRKIFRYMEDDLDKNDIYKPFIYLINDVCKRYNKTSTFVHAGRIAELEAFEYFSSIEKEKKLKENVEFGKLFSHQTLSFIMMLILKENPSFLEIFRPIYDFIDAQNYKAI